MKIHGERQVLEIPVDLGTKRNLLDGPMRVGIHKTKAPLYALKYVAPPIKDFMNFKRMENGNEVLINLDNHPNLSDSELIGGLIELASRAKNLDVDWNEHEITARCLKDLKERQPRMNSKNVA